MGIRIAMLTLTLLATVPACAAPVCPRVPNDLRDPALQARIGEDILAGIAIPNRFVDSPDLEFRGYDVEVTSRVAGLAAADQVMFVRVQDPLPGVELGMEMLLIGRRGPKPAEISPAGDCAPLAPMAG